MSVVIPIDCLDPEADPIIRRQLTFYPKANENLKRAQQPKAITCYRENDDFLWLPMHWVKKNVVFESPVKHRGKTVSFCPTVTALNEKQQRECDEVIDVLREKGTTTLTVRTGGGKTFIFLAAAAALRRRTLVLIWIENQISQIVNSIEEFTTAIPGIVTLKGLDDPQADIVVCLYSRWSKLTDKERQSFGTLVVDELHLFYNKRGMDAILAFHPEYAIGCTATLVNKRSGMHQLVYPIFGKSYVSSAFDVPFDVTKILTGIKGVRERNKNLKYGVDYNALTHSLMYNLERNKLIVDLVEIRLGEGHKMLVITSEVQHTLDLYQLCKARGISCDYIADKKKSYKDSDVLIGISKTCGVGFDEKSKCPDWNGVRIDKVILVIGVNTSHTLVQILGRSLRSKNPSIDHLVDDDPTIEKQFRNMSEEVYLPLGGKIEVCSLIQTCRQL